MKNFIKIIITIALFGMVMQSCKKQDLAGSSNANSGFTTRMTDTPADFKSLHLQITGVEAYLEGKGWVTLNTNLNATGNSVDILALKNGKELLLTQNATAEFGHYSKLKIKFGDESQLTYINTSSQGGGTVQSEVSVNMTFKHPEKEVVIEIDQDLSASQGINILLDFNVVKSVIESANQFIIDPVITLVKDEQTNVSGNIQGAVNSSIVLTNGNMTFDTFADAYGNFLIKGVEPGTYTAQVTSLVQDATGKLKTEEAPVQTVVVAEGQMTSMGTIKF